MTNNKAVTRRAAFFESNLELASKYLTADILALQEVDIGAERSFNINQIEALGQKIGYSHAATAINWDVRYLPFPYFPISMHFKKTVSAQALLTHYKIGKHTRFVLQKPDKPFYYKAFYIRSTHSNCRSFAPP